MKVFDSFGDNITIPAANIIAPQTLPKSGDPCVVGRLVGVANADAVSGGSVVLSTRGVYNLSVASIHNGVSIGETVYIDPTTAVLSDDFNDVPFGVALDAVAGGNVAATIRVRLFGATPGNTGADS